MSENPLITRSTADGRSSNPPGKKNKTYVWKPKNDIRINELARCIRFVTHPICHDPDKIDADCLRHFEVFES
jgi:hypothetical protein